MNELERNKRSFGASRSKQERFSLTICMIVFAVMLGESLANAFLLDGSSSRQCPTLMMASNEADDSHGKKSRSIENDFTESDFESSGVFVDDLSWRIEKLRLEEDNKRRFLKARPRFLPYDECRKWVIAMGRWTCEEDWNDWIAMGEKRNAYIPSCPDEYYGRLGQWVSWEHFLGTDKETKEPL